MTIHKSTRLTPVQRKEIADRYFNKKVRIATLAREYRVSRNSIYRILNRARVKDYSVHKSTNKRYQCLKYGIKRLAEGEKRTDKPETLYIAIDDFSRELYAAILSDKTQYSSTAFLSQVLEECPYTIETWYTDNGTEYKGNSRKHEFMRLCQENGIKQSFTRPHTPRTNGKAERVIKTIQDMWLKKTWFTSRIHRKQELIRFVNYYNTVKPHKGINNRTPMEQLINYFYPQEL